jgi:SPP1 gp7 family putative phage head morphogenesis protein
MKFLPSLTYKKSYERKIIKVLEKWMWTNIFAQCFKILKSTTVNNSVDDVLSYIQRNKLIYSDGAIYSVSGKFSNRMAKELEALGAKYSKLRNAYVIDKNKLPIGLAQAFDFTQAQTMIKAYAIQQYLMAQFNNLTELQKSFVIEGTVEEIMKNLQKRVYKSAKDHKIPFITPQLTSFQENEIAQRYVHNLDYWIKNWTEEQIVQMREVVAQMALEGKSLKTIEKYLLAEWTKDKKKAKFLARNESAIATTSYLASKYQQEGFTHFKWITTMDGRERELHKELNGKIFAFDNPPVIYDNKKGIIQRGLPGNTFNCRCAMSVVIDKSFLDNRKRLLQSKTGVFNSIRKFINNAKIKTKFNSYKRA